MIRKSSNVMFDPDTHPASKCPFFKEWVDQTGCGDGIGECGIYAAFMEDPASELMCPKTGPRGGNKIVAPDDCLLRRFEMRIVKKEKK